MPSRPPSPSWDFLEDPSSWDIVDEASFESFPASDPPAWGSYHAVATTSAAAPVEPVAPARQPRPIARVALVVLAGAAVLGATILLARSLRDVR